MGFFDYILGRKPNVTGGTGATMIVGKNVSWYKGQFGDFIKYGYKDNDVVYSAVNLVMDKARTPKWGLYKVEDESSLKAYNRIISKKDFSSRDFKEALTLQKKALVPISNLNSKTGKLKELLEWPNENETFEDLVANSIGNEMIFGNSFWDGNPLDMGADQGLPAMIENMPPQFVELIVTRGYPSRVVGYQINIDGLVKYPKERILHVKNWNPGVDISGSHLYGMSPLEAACKVLQRNNSAKTASVMAFENGGAVGVLYIDDERLKPDEAETQLRYVKNVWDQEMSGSDKFRKVAHSANKVGFAKITDTLVDLNIIPIENLDMRRIYNIFGVPSQLGNDPDNRTYNTQKEAEKALTSRCAMPRLVTRRNHFNKKLKSDWGFEKENVYTDFDLSVFTELQEDFARQWEAVKQLPMSSRDKLGMMAIDAPDNPALDEILIPSGYQRLEDVAMGNDGLMDELDKNDVEE